MDILVLGGTGFLAKETVLAFIRAGHSVTCAARGITGSPPRGARFVPWDRDADVPREIRELRPDVVVDVATNPVWVARTVVLFPHARWIYVSTISVYPTMAEPRGTPDNTAIHDPIDDIDDDGMEAYGGLKVACENHIRDLANHIIVRPGLIAGPRDPSGRFTYWPARLEQASFDGFAYIAPGPPNEPQQWIDVRDLSDWIVVLASREETGTVEAIGPPIPRGQLLSEVASLFTPEPTPIWLTGKELEGESVTFWSGERALPLWLPLPELAEMLNRDPRPARELGLRTRPLADTALDALSWNVEKGQGLSRTAELAVLRRLGYISDV